MYTFSVLITLNVAGLWPGMASSNNHSIWEKHAFKFLHIPTGYVKCHMTIMFKPHLLWLIDCQVKSHYSNHSWALWLYIMIAPCTKQWWPRVLQNGVILLWNKDVVRCQDSVNSRPGPTLSTSSQKWKSPGFKIIRQKPVLFQNNGKVWYCWFLRAMSHNLMWL